MFSADSHLVQRLTDARDRLDLSPAELFPEIFPQCLDRAQAHQLGDVFLLHSIRRQRLHHHPLFLRWFKSWSWHCISGQSTLDLRVPFARGSFDVCSSYNTII